MVVSQYLCYMAHNHITILHLRFSHSVASLGTRTMSVVVPLILEITQAPEDFGAARSAVHTRRTWLRVDGTLSAWQSCNSSILYAGRKHRLLTEHYETILRTESYCY